MFDFLQQLLVRLWIRDYPTVYEDDEIYDGVIATALDDYPVVRPTQDR